MKPSMSTPCSVVWSMPSPRFTPVVNSETLMLSNVVLSALIVMPVPPLLGATPGVVPLRKSATVPVKLPLALRSVPCRTTSPSPTMLSPDVLIVRLSL